MDKEWVIQLAKALHATEKMNCIPSEVALSPELVGVKIFEEPIFGIADANDALFNDLKKDYIIGKHASTPYDWLPSAQSVISVFFPFTQTIIDSNKEDMSTPSKGWLHGRVEGQQYINAFAEDLVQKLNESEYKTIAPSIDERFCSNTDKDRNQWSKTFTSNWSERHTAYICTLGTFSLSKGIITEKGMAGRLVSFITELQLEPDEKKFATFDENCINCDSCSKNCPANAISKEHGKNHILCSKFFDELKSKNAPWHGCGKCQVSVPCERKNPRALRNK